MIPYDMVVLLSFILLCGVLALLLVLISLSSRRDRERLRARAELETKLIDRIDSAQGFNDYLASGGLDRLDQSFELTGQPIERKIISLTACGLSISFFGAVLFFLFGWLQLLGDAAALIAAVLVLSFGLALLLMAYVTHRMSLAWGLIKRNSEKHP